MEEIYILGKDNKYEHSSVLDEELKIQRKKNDDRSKRDDRDVQEDEGEAGEVAPDVLHGGGESTVGEG